MTPEIRIIVLDTTGPTERLAVENCARAAALAFHGLAGTQKPRLPGQTGPNSKSVSQLRGSRPRPLVG